MSQISLKLSAALWVLALVTLSSAAAANDTVLADAAEKREFDELRTLIERHVDVNEAQADGMTALHWAVYHDASIEAKLLVEAGAQVESKNRYGVTPLALACQNGNGELVELLLTEGADPNTSLPSGETALMTASRTGRPEPVKSLLSHGADVNVRERSDQTALMWAAAEGHAAVVEALIAAGAEVNAKLPSEFTAFFFAVREGRNDIMRQLLDTGCDVNELLETKNPSRFGRDPSRLTPLLLAVENGHFELAKQLLEAGADPNAHPGGYTALHAMTWVRKPIRGDGDPSPRGSGKYNSLDMVRMLIDAGADVNASFRRGKSELGRFTYSGSTPFLLAAQASDVPLMKLLIELGADPVTPSSDGTTPLLAAAGVGALGDGDESAGTEEEAIAAVEYLLQLGADINVVDGNGETAMHGAAYQSRGDLARVLVENGADIAVWNHENRAGWTPLVIARGYRPGNFRPSPPTISAIEEAMSAAGVRIPTDLNAGSHRRVWTSTGNKGTPWVIRDIEYGRVGDLALLLDLHLPQKVTDSNLVVWVHGGAWRSGTKEDMPLSGLVDAGYTVASVEYRLSPVAPFPAQVHDIKAAIRYLRAISSRYGYRSDHIAIAGDSAGGHLAALVGTTNGHQELEGTIGNHRDQSSNVQAIIDYFGPTNLMTIVEQSTPHGIDVRVPALQLLLRGQPEDNPELAKLASPVEHLDTSDPPLLLIHGDQDPQVPINQAHELHGKYKKLGLPVQFEVLYGAVHGGERFYDDAVISTLQTFLEENLQPQ
jgi:ankyrin repeat protein/acetyl esterase/lipase